MCLSVSGHLAWCLHCTALHTSSPLCCCPSVDLPHYQTNLLLHSFATFTRITHGDIHPPNQLSYRGDMLILDKPISIQEAGIHRNKN